MYNVSENYIYMAFAVGCDNVRKEGNLQCQVIQSYDKDDVILQSKVLQKIRGISIFENTPDIRIVKTDYGIYIIKDLNIKSGNVHFAIIKKEPKEEEYFECFKFEVSNGRIPILESGPKGEVTIARRVTKTRGVYEVRTADENIYICFPIMQN